MKPILFAVVGGLSLAVLSACTSPPQQHKITTEAIIERSQAETWQRLVAWSSTAGLPINLADERSGTLQATLTSAWIGRHVDCGQTHSVTLPDPNGLVTVQLAPKGEDTGVVVRVTATDKMWLAESSGEIVRAPCYSRGTLEQEIFSALR